MSDGLFSPEELPEQAAPESDAPYRVLARKYRPQNFEDLIGQESLVQTLSNAIKHGRIAHAYLLTGIRGIGKTTTARIIARALNCVGEDGTGGPTMTPCGVCANCKAIREDRHVDVMEMDAASRTGVGDIRELIDMVRYAPTNARYKIYIIDEVHMLSTNAFNALLKTLEEPPEHAIFIFATTELRKVPVTVLSRCQKFDLRRIEPDMLVTHLSNICGKESVQAEPEALQLIAQSAEGSVRDALSLLDQAIAMSEETVTAEHVRSMVGRGDRSQLFGLLDVLMQGDVKAALTQGELMYGLGYDPTMLLEDMLDVVHLISRVQLTPELLNDVTLPEMERERSKELAEKLSIPVLARCWQMLLKGLQEIKQAAHARQALDMILIRIAYAAELPTPEKVISDLKNGTIAPPASPPVGGGGPSHNPPSGGGVPSVGHAPSGGGAVSAAQTAVQPQAEVNSETAWLPQSYEELVREFELRMEPMLYFMLQAQMGLVRFDVGTLEIAPLSDHLPSDSAGKIRQRLEEWSGQRWMVSLVSDATKAQPSLAKQAEAAFEDEKNHWEQHPAHKKMQEHFAGAKIIEIQDYMAQ